jgi:Cu/Ag efflux pump CusA
MRWLVGSSLKFRLLIIPLMVAVIFLGFTQIRAMPVDVLPEFTPPTVQVQTEALGLSAAEVEQLVTVPLEQDLLNGVPWLDEIRSTSVTGLSSIDLVFEPGTEILRARQVVQERLTQAHALPNVSKPPVMVQPVSSTSRVMMIALSSRSLSLIDMSVLARWRVRPRLMGVTGVANVSVWGMRERQLQVQVDPARLAQSGVTLNQIITTTGNALWVSPLTFVEASTPGTAGFIDTPNQRLTIQHVLPIRTPQDLGRVRIEGTAADNPLTLGAVSTVVEDHQPLIGDAVVGEGTGLMLVVERFPGANPLEVTRGIEEALTAMRPGLAGVTIDTTVYRPATFIEDALGNLGGLALLALLVLLVLFGAFLYDWRSGVIAAVSVPTALGVAGVVVALRGGTLNLMVLGGLVLAVAVLIDDAIVDVEHIRRHVREAREAGSDRSAVALVTEASLAVRSPMAFATVILAVLALPALFLGGLIGSFAGPLAWTYILAILAGMLVALTVTPALSLLLLARAGTVHRDSPLAGAIRRATAPVLVRFLRRTTLAVLVAVTVLLVGVAVVPWLRGEPVLPAQQDRNLLIRFDGPPGTSQPEMVRGIQQAANDLRAVPGVRTVGAHVGRAITADRIVNVNSGELWLSLADGADHDAAVVGIRTVLERYTGFETELLTYPQQRLDAVRTGSGDDLVVRVYGVDYDVLNAKADQISGLMAGVAGVRSVRVPRDPQEQTVEIEVNLAAAQRYGLKPGDVRRAIAILVSGLQVGSLFEDQKVFDVVVWGVPGVRTNVDSIRQILIDAPAGGQVRLMDVADVRVRPNVSAIHHDAVSRHVDVIADVRGRSVADVVRDVEARLGGVDFPIEYHAEVLGTYAERTGARNRAIGLALLAVLAALLLLQAAFGNWRMALLVWLTAPTALVGGAVAAILGGWGTSLGVLLGLFLVLSLTIRHSVLLVSRLQQADTDGVANRQAEVARVAEERTAPIVMSTLTVVLALLPLALFSGAATEGLLRPLAVVTIGGSLTHLLLTLFLLPALYLRFGRRIRRPAPEPAPAAAEPAPAERVTAGAGD